MLENSRMFLSKSNEKLVYLYFWDRTWLTRVAFVHCEDFMQKLSKCLYVLKVIVVHEKFSLAVCERNKMYTAKAIVETRRYFC